MNTIMTNINCSILHKAIPIIKYDYEKMIVKAINKDCKECVRLMLETKMNNKELFLEYCLMNNKSEEIIILFLKNGVKCDSKYFVRTLDNILIYALENKLFDIRTKKDDKTIFDMNKSMDIIKYYDSEFYHTIEEDKNFNFQFIKYDLSGRIDEFYFILSYLPFNITKKYFEVYPEYSRYIKLKEDEFEIVICTKKYMNDLFDKYKLTNKLSLLYEFLSTEIELVKLIDKEKFVYDETNKDLAKYALTKNNIDILKYLYYCREY